MRFKLLYVCVAVHYSLCMTHLGSRCVLWTSVLPVSLNDTPDPDLQEGVTP